MLAEDRFQTDSPRPLKGFFEWLADLLPSFDWLDDLIPGPPGVTWLGLAAVIGVLAWVLGRRVLTRRIDTSEAAQAADGRRAMTRARSSGSPPRPRRPASSRRRCGCDSAPGCCASTPHGAIDYRPSISTREVSRKLRSEDFDALALTFDDVVYGGRAAEDADVEEARSRWREVVKR